MILLLLLCFPYIVLSEMNQCLLYNGRCNYQVTVVDSCGDSSSSVWNWPQDDNGRVDQLEQSLQEIRTEHTRKLAGLESKLSQLLQGPLSAEPKPLPFELRTEREEDRLLAQLHREFNIIRIELNDTKNKLGETERQLGVTRQQLLVTKNDLARYKVSLAETEAKLEVEKQQNRQHLDDIKQSKASLTAAQLEGNECQELYNKQKMDLQQLGTEKKSLRDDVDQCRESLAQAKVMLDRALIKYHELNIRHENTSVKLNATEEELIRCTGTKVASFCGFEDPKLCGFRNDPTNRELDWQLWAGASPSLWTGPKTDSTCGNDRGHYMLVATASGSKHSYRSRLVSPEYRGLDQQCIEFHYHMFGHHVGTLNVYLLVDTWDDADFPPPVWRAYGNQGDLWSMAKLSVPAEVSRIGYQVVFEALTEAGYAGDVALDDVRVLDQPCRDMQSLMETRARLKNQRIDNMRKYREKYTS